MPSSTPFTVTHNLTRPMLFFFPLVQMDEQLTTYEEERNARIASNQQLLESLGLHTEVAALKSAGKNEIINIPTVLPPSCPGTFPPARPGAAVVLKLPEPETPTPGKKRGRPPGSKNKTPSDLTGRPFFLWKQKALTLTFTRIALNTCIDLISFTRAHVKHTQQHPPKNPPNSYPTDSLTPTLPSSQTTHDSGATQTEHKR